jgi:hypothetical protein
MLDNVLVPLLPHPLIPLAQSTMQWRNETDVETK